MPISNGQSPTIMINDSSSQKPVTLPVNATSFLLNRNHEDGKFYFRKEFQICYQPVVSLANGQLESFEALPRWQPDRQCKFLYPADFLPILQDLGLMIPLGEWMLFETSSQLVHWKHQFPFTHPQISVNLSLHQLDGNRLMSHLATIADAARGHHKPFQVELSASILQPDPPARLALLREIFNQGIEICLDDVEPSAEMLEILKFSPVAAIKLPIALTQTLSEMPSNLATFIETFIENVHALNIKTIAKGVETTEQYSFWEQLGCQYGQGYLFDEPLRLTQVVTRLIMAERQAMLSLKAHLAVIKKLDTAIKSNLDAAIANRYWQTAKPVSVWLENWYPDQNPMTLLEHHRDDSITPQQRSDLQMWVQQFLNHCQETLPDLPTLLRQSALSTSDLHLLKIHANLPKREDIHRQSTAVALS